MNQLLTALSATLSVILWGFGGGVGDIGFPGVRGRKRRGDDLCPVSSTSSKVLPPTSIILPLIDNW